MQYQSFYVNFYIKLETNLGESEFSGVLTVKTLDEDSEVGHFGDEIKGKIFLLD